VLTVYWHSPVSLLSSGSGTWATKLSRLASSGISNQKSSIVLQQQVLDLAFLGFIDVLLVECDYAFRDGLFVSNSNYLPDRVNLGGTTTSSHLDSDVESAGSLATKQKERLKSLGPQREWLDEIDG
jgi:hypothetical protein